MKKTTALLALTLCACLAQPSFTNAKDKDKNKDEEPQGKKSPAKGGGPNSNRGHAPSPGHATVQSIRPGSSAPRAVEKIYPGRGRTGPAIPVPTIAPANVRASQPAPMNALTGRTRFSRAVAPSAVTQTFQTARSSGRSTSSPNFDYRSLNRSNAYGGRWVQGSDHRDWDRNRVHYSGNHGYRWYDNGWLVIDGGFWPPDYSGGYSGRTVITSGYISEGTVVAVQRKLYALGYYEDSIDGDFGPNTANAIARYQRDSGLSATGRISNTLLDSLGLR